MEILEPEIKQEEILILNDPNFTPGQCLYCNRCRQRDRKGCRHCRCSKPIDDRGA